MNNADGEGSETHLATEKWLAPPRRAFPPPAAIILGKDVTESEVILGALEEMSKLLFTPPPCVQRLPYVL